MVKGIMVAIAVVVLAVAGYFIYDAARGMQDEVQTPTATIDIAKDQAAKSSLVAIRTAIQSYAAVNGQLPPAADQATLGGFVAPWPTNPWTKGPMKPGSGVGDYVYTPGAGTSFTLTVHLSGDVPAEP